MSWVAHAARMGKKLNECCDFVVKPKGKRALVQ
jgi:hypothetical protein